MIFARHECGFHNSCFFRPLAVPEKICASLPRLCLIFIDRCAFLALLHLPPDGNPHCSPVRNGEPLWRRNARQQSPLKNEPVCGAQNNLRRTTVPLLDYFDRCTFLALLVPPPDGNPHCSPCSQRGTPLAAQCSSTVTAQK